MQLAVRNGYLDIAERLVRDKRVDPNWFYDIYTVVKASERGRVEILQRLLADQRTVKRDSSGDNGLVKAVVAAGVHGRQSAFDILVRDRRLDPKWKEKHILLHMLW